MTGVAVLLVLGSAFLHALWNARSNAGADRVAELAVAYGVGAVLLGPWLVVDPPVEALGFVVLSGLAHGGYVTFLARAYTTGGLATTYPLARGTAPLIVAVFGAWLLDQTPSARTVVGAALVAAGLAVIGGVAWHRGERRAIVDALVTGGFIAAYTLLDARGIEQTSELGYFSAASAVAVVAAVSFERASLERLRRRGARTAHRGDRDGGVLADPAGPRPLMATPAAAAPDPVRAGARAPHGEPPGGAGRAGGGQKARCSWRSELPPSFVPTRRRRMRSRHARRPSDPGDALEVVGLAEPSRQTLDERERADRHGGLAEVGRRFRQVDRSQLVEPHAVVGDDVRRRVCRSRLRASAISRIISSARAARSSGLRSSRVTPSGSAAAMSSSRLGSGSLRRCGIRGGLDAVCPPPGVQGENSWLVPNGDN
ncbi:MAG: hypothetical protein R2695_18285 [Acidimicrobiales bacterium]